MAAPQKLPDDDGFLPTRAVAAPQGLPVSAAGVLDHGQSTK